MDTFLEHVLNYMAHVSLSPTGRASFTLSSTGARTPATQPTRCGVSGGLRFLPLMVPSTPQTDPESSDSPCPGI